MIYFGKNLILCPILSLQSDDEDENVPEKEEEVGMFSRRKLESNWDRYEESEKVEDEDEIPTRRGTDFDVLLAAAGKTLPPPSLTVELILLGVITPTLLLMFFLQCALPVAEIFSFLLLSTQPNCTFF